MASGESSLRVLRSIITEIRYINQKQKLNELLSYQHIMTQFRKYRVTDQKLCRSRDEMLYLARTYYCYLFSTRRHKELYSEYHGKGERSVSESANLVGLRLPKVYEENAGEEK